MIKLSKKKKGIKFSRELTPAQVEKYKSFGVPDMSQNWLELFTDELVDDLFTIMRSCSNNQQKAEYIEKELKYYGFTIVGEGTNIIVMANPVYPGVVFKIALDDNGVADNFNDCILQDCIPRYVPVYARHPSSIVTVQPRGVLPTPDQMIRFRPDIIRLLKEVSKYFLIADLSPDMFLNYIVDRDGKFLICDGSDLYPLHQFKNNKLPGCKRITGSHRKTGKSKHCEGKLRYTEDFKWLVCEKCGLSHNPLELRPKKEVDHVYQTLTDGYTAEGRDDLEKAAYEAVVRQHKGILDEDPEEYLEDEDYEGSPDDDEDEEDEDLPDVDLDNDSEDDDLDDADEDDEEEIDRDERSRGVSRTVFVYPDRPADVLEEPMDDNEDDDDYYIRDDQNESEFPDDGIDDEDDGMMNAEESADPTDEDMASFPEDLLEIVLNAQVSGADYYQGILDYLVNSGYKPSFEQAVPAQGDTTKDIQGITDEGLNAPEESASVTRVAVAATTNGNDEPLSELKLAVNDGQDTQPTVISDVIEYLAYLKRRDIFAYADIIQRISRFAGIVINTEVPSTPEKPCVLYTVRTDGDYPAIYVDVNAEYHEISKAFDEYGLPIFVCAAESDEYYLAIRAAEFKKLLMPTLNRIHADAEEARINALNQSEDDNEDVENESDDN